MSESVGMASPGPKRAWPRLEAEMRNHFPSYPSSHSQAGISEALERLPYSTRDLPAWQIDLIDRFPLLYRCPEVGRDDYCHLSAGFNCSQEWAPAIREMSAMAEALVRALRGSAHSDARFTVAEVSEVEGRLRWTINTNLFQPFLGFIHDYF